MNVFNRIVMVVIVLALLVAVAFVMMRPVTSASIAQGVVASFQDLILAEGSYNAFLGVGAAVLLLLLALLWLEIRPSERRFVQVQTKGRGTANLGLESVAHSLEYRIDELAGVRKVVSRLYSTGREVDVALDVDASPSVDVPSLTEQVISMAHDIVEGQLGLKIHNAVVVNVKYEPYPRGTLPPTQPLGEEGVLRPTMVGRSPEAARPPETAPTAAQPGVPERPAPERVEPVEPKRPEPEAAPVGVRAPREEIARPATEVQAEPPSPAPRVPPVPVMGDRHDEGDETIAQPDGQ